MRGREGGGGGVLFSIQFSDNSATTAVKVSHSST